MAVLTPDQVKKVWSDDGARRWSLFAVLNATTGDTIDMAAHGHARIVKQAMAMGCTVNGTATATVTQPATVTIPAGLAADALYLLIDCIPI